MGEFMDLIEPGLKIQKTSDRFELTICDGESALTATLFWEPSQFKASLEEFIKTLADTPIPEKREIFLDDFHGETFPPEWDRQERFSLLLDLVDHKPALVAQYQKPDAVGLRFERAIWHPKTGDSFYRLSQQLNAWMEDREFDVENSDFVFIDSAT
jgi:hypothetical protein